MRKMLIAGVLLVASAAYAQDNTDTTPPVPAVNTSGQEAPPPPDTSAAPAVTAPGTDNAGTPPAAADTGTPPADNGIPPPADNGMPAPADNTAPPAPDAMAPAAPGTAPTPEEYNGEHEYISILGSFVMPDGHSRGTTYHGGGGTVLWGHLLSDNLSVEVAPTFSIFDTGQGKGTDFYQYGGTIDGAWAFTSRTQSSIVPFVLAGVGGAYEDVQPVTGKKGVFLADAGAGVTGPIAYGLKWRAEARYVHDFQTQFHGHGDNDYRFSAGLEIPLGRVVHTVQAAPEPVQVVKEVPRPWVDSDGDGVDDEHDKCPNTPHGLKVDADGCVIPGQVIVLRGVTFEFNKSRIQPNAAAVLDNIVPAFTGQATLRVEIGGHTDSIGSAAYNQGLSQRRAEAVREYLISKGAKPEQLTAVGYGKSQLLINPEKNADDRELNRRVEFKVVGK